MSEPLRTIIFQELREKYPDIDWELGSTIRELVAEPVAKLGDIANQYIAEAENRFDIVKILDNPTEYSDIIEELAEKLNITSPDETVATGTVRVLLNDAPSLFVIARSTQFTWSDVSLLTVGETRWSLTPSDSDTKQLRTIGPNSYMAEVEVQASGEGELALASGAPVNWMGASRYVYDCSVGSAITGGRRTYTLVEMAQMIRDILFPANYCGELGIKNSLRHVMPLLVKDVVVGEKPTNKPGTVCLYVQTGRAPEQWTTQAISKKVDGKIVLQTRLPGVYAIHEVYNTDGTNMRFKAEFDSSDCTITLLKDGVANATYMIVCEGLKDYAEIQSKLYAESKNTPYDFVAGTPIIANIGLDLIVSAPREITETHQAIIELQRYITSLPINTYLIDDTVITKLLEPYGISLAAPTIYTADVISTTERRKRVTAGSINLQDVVYAPSAAVIMYCYNDGIKVTNV